MDDKTKDLVVQSETIQQLDESERTYVYQWMNAFEPFFLQDSKFDVFVKEVNKDRTRVLVQIQTMGVAVGSEGDGESFFEAVRNASQRLLDHLQHIQAEMMASDGEQILENISNKRKLH